MRRCHLRRYATPRGTLQIPLLNQVGLVHVLKRVRLLTNGRGQGLQTRWTTLEPRQKKRQQLPVQIVQPFMINPEGIEGVTRNTQCDHAVGHDLGIVAHPSQEAQSHAGVRRDRRAISDAPRSSIAIFITRAALTNSLRIDSRS